MKPLFHYSAPTHELSLKPITPDKKICFWPRYSQVLTFSRRLQCILTSFLVLLLRGNYFSWTQSKRNNSKKFPSEHGWVPDPVGGAALVVVPRLPVLLLPALEPLRPLSTGHHSTNQTPPYFYCKLSNESYITSHTYCTNTPLNQPDAVLLVLQTTQRIWRSLTNHLTTTTTTN